MLTVPYHLLQALEPIVHGRGRKEDSLDETYMGVYENLLYARKTKPVEGTTLDALMQYSSSIYCCLFLVLSRSLKECANFYESSGHIPIFFFLAFRSSMDGDSDNYCRGDAKSWDGGSCYLCSEVWLASNLVKNNLVLPPG